MRRLALAIVRLYLLSAVIGRFVEGMAVTCRCASDCWCKKPVVGTFRWVFPFKHRIMTEG